MLGRFSKNYMRFLHLMMGIRTYLIQCEICGEQYTGSTKTKFMTRANNCKSTHRTIVNEEEVPKQALTQKHFHKNYWSDRHNGIQGWVITDRYC